jgi:SNF2 family DNA or RNA helicase
MEMKVFCNLTPEQASLYKSVVAETTRALDAATGIRRKGVILAALTKLKQVCNHPAQFLGDESPLAGRSGKLSRLTEMVEELLSEGDRALIFSQFADMGERLRSHLWRRLSAKRCCFLHGGVPAHKRDEMVERFQSGGEGSAAVRAVAEGRRHGAESHGRQPRLPLRPLVESRRGKPGHRPRVSHRAAAQCADS